jgi:succinoglycan biosynthesis protein ExoA
MTDELPRLTVVIPACNEQRFISRTIQYLLNQDYPSDRVELLVGIADSTDQTEEVVRKMAAGEPRLKWFHNPYGLSSGARTLGAQMAGGEIILFIDAHVFIDNTQLFRNTVRLMYEKQVSVLSRPQLLDTPDNSFFQRAVSLARNSPLGHARDSTIYSRNEGYVSPSSSGASYRKEVFEKVGYFDLSFDACEDVDFNYRCAKAGYRSYISMDLAVYYYPRSSLRSLFRQMARYGAGRYRLARKHPGTLSFGALMPFFLTAGLPLLGLVCLIWPMLLFLPGFLAVTYVLTVTLFSVSLAARHGWAFLPALCAIFPAIHLGLGWGFIRQLCASLFRPGNIKAILGNVA